MDIISDFEARLHSASSTTSNCCMTCQQKGNETATTAKMSTTQKCQTATTHHCYTQHMTGTSCYSANSTCSKSANSGCSDTYSPCCIRNIFAHTITLQRFCALLLFFTLISSGYSCGPGRGIGGPRRNRKLTPLVFKQHVPNMSEKTLGASGLNEGPISRVSKKFKDLVPNYNKDIIFKDEEGTGADRLMTRRCKEKLNTLAVSVMNQWPGVILRVTESWDEDKLHGDDSLHYEGRAVDITTSDRDRAKYGMLARLAVEAGFDWVYYESRAHIHCSVKSDSSHISHMSGCFTTDSTVLTANGTSKTMNELAIGDRVLSMSANGDPIYSEVILFMDRNLELTQEFVQLRTVTGATLTVTPAHLVLVWNPQKKLMDYVFADHVEEGDFVFVHDVQGHLRPQRVTVLSSVLRKGVIAPLTREGTIVVNTVAASCYAIVNSQKLAHWGMAPMRLMATMKSWMPHGEVSTTKSTLPTSIGKKVAAITTAKQQNGVHWYAKVLYKLKDYVVPHEWRYE